LQEHIPNLNPSYDEHKELFEKLWREGIEAQKDKISYGTLVFVDRVMFRFGKMMINTIPMRQDGFTEGGTKRS
jgi:hypothetical protein